MNKIGKILPSLIFYLDESGFDLNMIREYGYQLKSRRLLAERSGNRKNRRISVIGVRNHKHQLIHPLTFEGSTTKQLFKVYLQEILLPNLPKNSYLIMDNATFHKGEDIEELIKSYSINLIYLPTYSPDLNPIEKKWSQIKSYYRKLSHKWENKEKLLNNILSCNQYARLV